MSAEQTSALVIHDAEGGEHLIHSTPFGLAAIEDVLRKLNAYEAAIVSWKKEELFWHEENAKLRKALALRNDTHD